MSTFSNASTGAQLPVRYRDARSELRFRVVDSTEKDPPDILVTSRIGDGLVAAITWGPVAVTSDVMRMWGVSIDEAMATAAANIAALAVERPTRGVEGAKVEMTVGHHWVSSLIVDRARYSESEEGFLVAIPRSDVMVTTPVVGAETVDSLETLMAVCEELFDPDGLGISPFVWWWYQDHYWRVTGRADDGTIDLPYHTHFAAYRLVGAISHLAHPCAECERE